MIAAKKLVIKFVRRDLPICPHHGPEFTETMRPYSKRKRTTYYICRQAGCEFTTKVSTYIVTSR